MPISNDFASACTPSCQPLPSTSPPYLRRGRHPRHHGPPARVLAKVAGFKEYYAAKALPNPRILALLRELGCGFDCSSIAELVLARQAGARGEEIMFTSNNTSPEEFAVAAQDGGCILNLDDLSLVAKVPQMPELVCFRCYNPGAERSGNSIIGNPLEAKYGVPHAQLLDAFRAAQARGRGALACTPCWPRTSATTATWCRR